MTCIFSLWALLGSTSDSCKARRQDEKAQVRRPMMSPNQPK